MVAGGAQGLVAEPAAVLQLELAAGGATAKITASLISENAAIARPATALALIPGPPRSSQGRRRMKARPEFCPRPLKPKPEIVIADATSSCSPTRKCSPTFSSTARVRSIVLPGGSSTCTVIAPWSSSGRKPVGMRTNRAATPTHSARKATMASQRQRTSAPTMR